MEQVATRHCRHIVENVRKRSKFESLKMADLCDAAEHVVPRLANSYSSLDQKKSGRGSSPPALLL